VFLPQNGSQLPQLPLSSRGGEKLVRVRSSFMADSYGFSTPDQLPSAPPEAFPSSYRILGRSAISRCVPTFHRLDSNAVTDFERTAHQGQAQWRLRSG
jgi:hypothetical protein